MKSFLAALAVVLIFGSRDQAEAVPACTSGPIAPTCAVRANRDILFLVEGSDKIDPSRFFGELLDYTKGLFCAFNPADTVRAGLVVFGKTTEEMVPFKQYSADEWYTAVDALKTQQEGCCACCSPLASALSLARDILQRNVSAAVAFSSVIIISNGKVWQK